MERDKALVPRSRSATPDLEPMPYNEMQNTADDYHPEPELESMSEYRNRISRSERREKVGEWLGSGQFAPPFQQLGIAHSSMNSTGGIHTRYSEDLEPVQYGGGDEDSEMSDTAHSDDSTVKAQHYTADDHVAAPPSITETEESDADDTTIAVQLSRPSQPQDEVDRFFRTQIIASTSPGLYMYNKAHNTNFTREELRKHMSLEHIALCWGVSCVSEAFKEYDTLIPKGIKPPTVNVFVPLKPMQWESELILTLKTIAPYYNAENASRLLWHLMLERCLVDGRQKRTEDMWLKNTDAQRLWKHIQISIFSIITIADARNQASEKNGANHLAQQPRPTWKPAVPQGKHTYFVDPPSAKESPAL